MNCGIINTINNGPPHQLLKSTCLRQYKATSPTAPLPMPYSTRARASAVAVPSTRKQPPLSPQRQPLKPVRARLRAPKTLQDQNVSHYCGQPFVELEPVSQSWQPEWPAIRKQVSDNDIGRADVRLCAGFRTPECQDHPRAAAASVRKAPRHEIAGCGAPRMPRALWGFGRGVSVEDVEVRRRIRSLFLEAWACVPG